ncbi:hypothetical protein VMCG_06632 [Cytospora schulzeri]|uniref:Uncharacterized protein n=1 Tax=Cytospora schulzeri TaxID=448051 RepID=A0A423W6T6_9PEZI|nr:hypothetical protein VMCG_06632 [Valsa malicola]
MFLSIHPRQPSSTWGAAVSTKTCAVSAWFFISASICASPTPPSNPFIVEMAGHAPTPITLTPDIPLRIRGLQLAVDAQDPPGVVDGDLRIKKGVPPVHALRHAEVDGDAGVTAGLLDGADGRVRGAAHHALLRVPGEDGGLV